MSVEVVVVLIFGAPWRKWYCTIFEKVWFLQCLEMKRKGLQ